MIVRIGPYELANNLALAPMAGVTDLPFRLLCRELGAGIAAGEMLTSDTRLWHTEKSRRRMDHGGEPEPRVVQIAGGEPGMMADAARRNADAGAQIIDINMGCPAKKVCNKAAGSALLRDTTLVADILSAVVKAVTVPVTLKIRTGWDPEHRNGVAIARLAEDCGVQSLAVHGRTRACHYTGNAEHATAFLIKQAVTIPVFVNGDIDSPQKAKAVLEETRADGLMIGRSAQGRPWIFREIHSYLTTGQLLAPPSAQEVRDIMLAHLCNLHDFYGEETGVRVARKHIGWYAKDRPGATAFWQAIVKIDRAMAQLDAVRGWFDALADETEQHISDAA